MKGWLQILLKTAWTPDMSQNRRCMQAEGLVVILMGYFLSKLAHADSLWYGLDSTSYLSPSSPTASPSASPTSISPTSSSPTSSPTTSAPITAAPTAAPVNKLTNGDFESDSVTSGTYLTTSAITGWTVALLSGTNELSQTVPLIRQSSSDWGGLSSGTDGGNNYLGLQGTNTIIYQSLTLSTSTSYVISLLAAGRPSVVRA
ncbi:hypothetical protein CYMTET_36332 [Cymbomonas tetramitiformis]|uniref:Uncharacterized protein n=1 Tax=Cymbomonas tetramitiformis TaxID=36881 RepID=A0AAE0F7L4_9CHLO|nr:hypothetical protein CYMTET_36332 [Cymbomonas tetramitiformis]